MFEREIAPFFNNYLETLGESKIAQALKYSLEGGKCIRGFIVKHILETVNPDNLSWEPIVAVELIQSASLIIDDLPSMDNDAMRRGKPSTFKMFGENETVLTSLYMVAESLRIMNTKIFELSDHTVMIDRIPKSQQAIKSLINEWCVLLGQNLAVGQMMDLKGDVENIFNVKLSNSKDNSEILIKYKTCSLFSFTFVVGAAFANKDLELEDFKQMGLFFGLMFQLMDDYNDKKTDDVFANYILSQGEAKAREKYIESRTALLVLLEKNNILTDRFKHLIGLIDSKFINYPMLKKN
jgi:geranylgeranyl diphosphate synthase, type II